MAAPFMNLCAPDQGVFAIANVGLPVQYCRPNEKQATGNNERKVRSILLLGNSKRIGAAK